MTKEEMRRLQPGAVIRHARSSDAMIVTANYGDHVIAVRTAYVCNPAEWQLVATVPSPSA